MNGSKDNRLLGLFSHITLAAITVAIIAPFILMIVASLTENESLIANGYSFLPKDWSLEAYTYLAKQSSTIGRAFLMSIFVTVVGTFLGLLMSAMLAYVLSKSEFKGAKFAMLFIAITLLFNGGLVPTYILYAQYLGMKNSVLALIVPGLLMNGFTVFMIRNYFVNSVPKSLFESATIDGAGEFVLFFRIAIPLSLPIMATAGLLAALLYWNDWFNGMIYVSNPDLYSIQLLLNRMLQDIQFMTDNPQLRVSGQKVPGASIRMALALVGSLPLIIAFPFFERYFVRGITNGALKG